MNWHHIPNEWIAAKDGVRKLNIAGKSICLIKEKGVLYATSAKCPHAGADLSGGWCENGRLICPYHRHAFDLSSGRGDPGQGDYIRVYPLKKQGEDWLVGIPESGLKTLVKAWFKS